MIVAGSSLPEPIARKTLTPPVRGVIEAQRVGQLVVALRRDEFAAGFQNHGADDAGDHLYEVLAIAHPQIPLPVDQVEEVERGREPVETPMPGTARVSDGNVLPARIGQVFDLFERRGGHRPQLRLEHRIDHERLGQHQMPDDLRRAAERLSRPPSQVVSDVDEHAGARPAAHAGRDMHRGRAARNQLELPHVPLHVLLHGRAELPESGGDRLVNDAFTQLGEDQPSQTGNALAAVVGEHGVQLVPQGREPIQVRMQFGVLRTIANHGADVQILKQIVEIRETGVRRPPLLQCVGIQLQEPNERRYAVVEEVPNVPLEPLAHQHARAAKPHDQSGAHHDKAIVDSHASVSSCWVRTCVNQVMLV